jgi:hypothetical protein
MPPFNVSCCLNLFRLVSAAERKDVTQITSVEVTRSIKGAKRKPRRHCASIGLPLPFRILSTVLRLLHLAPWNCHRLQQVVRVRRARPGSRWLFRGWSAPQWHRSSNLVLLARTKRHCAEHVPASSVMLALAVDTAADAWRCCMPTENCSPVGTAAGWHMRAGNRARAIAAWTRPEGSRCRWLVLRYARDDLNFCHHHVNPVPRAGTKQTRAT